jgi:hypothetical protein
MGIARFVIVFIISLIGVIFLQDFTPNKFISAFIIALILAVLGSKD